MPNNRQETLTQSNEAGTVTKNNQLMVSTVVFVFIVVILIFILYLYVKRKMNPTSSQQTSASPQTQIISNGLDKEILKSLPVTVYKAWESEESEECAVCLSEIKNGEEVRLLPKCKHGFHLQCIDMWLHSHSTCPLCRCPITKELGPEGSSGICRGDIVIDIPMRETRQTAVDSPLPVSKFAEEGEAANPSLSRVGTLTRLWSRGKMVIGACSPTGYGIDKGVVGEVSTSTHKANASL